MKIISLLFLMVPISSFAEIRPWNCSGKWVFESYTLNPAVDVAGEVQTNSEVNQPVPLNLIVGGLALTGTAVLRPPYEISLQNPDRSVRINGTMKVAVDPGTPLKLTVLLNGQSTSGNLLTGILTCLPK